jgi:AcrR family transcriptional regulator
MPQVLKDEVRARILTAALEVFAAESYVGAAMSAIAARAGLGTATIYRYYKGKDELFDAVITPDLARRFASLLDRRVRALGRIALAGGSGERDDVGEEMLRFWIDHRLAVVVLLDRAEGTAYARYGAQFVEQLLAQTIAEIRAERPGLRVGAPTKFVLRRIFENTRGMLAAILEEHGDERAVREATEAFWSYQIPGLRGFAQKVLSG